MWAAVGLPFGRGLCCIPPADDLKDWNPINPIEGTVSAWRDQALGTSMMMAYFINNDLVPSDLLHEQVMA